MEKPPVKTMVPFISFLGVCIWGLQKVNSVQHQSSFSFSVHDIFLKLPMWLFLILHYPLFVALLFGPTAPFLQRMVGPEITFSLLLLSQQDSQLQCAQPTLRSVELSHNLLHSSRHLLNYLTKTSTKYKLDMHEVLHVSVKRPARAARGT